MFIDELQRHLAVCGMLEVDQFTTRDRNFWNIISIYDPFGARQRWQRAKDIHYACFHDAEKANDEDIRLIESEDIANILRFVDLRPNEPMLIHCKFGVARSTAVALILIVRGLVMDGFEDVVDSAVDTLLEIRRQACPNGLVLRLGLETFMNIEEAQKLTIALINHPRLIANAAKNKPQS